MKLYIEKIKSWYSSLKISEPSYEKEGVSPYKDWRIILTSTFVALVVLAGAAYYFYIEVDSGNFFTVSEETEGNEVKINNTLFKKIVDDINNRKQSMENIQKNKIAPPDPSL